MCTVSRTFVTCQRLPSFDACQTYSVTVVVVVEEYEVEVPLVTVEMSDSVLCWSAVLLL